MKKGIFQEVTNKRLGENGNLIEETAIKTWTSSNKISEPFFFTYINCISWIYGLKSITTIKILYKLLERAEFNTNKVEISSKKRSEIIKELEITDSSFTKCLNQLIDLNILQGSKGSYTIDENFFWKGDRKTRDTLMNARLKMTIEPDFETVDPDTGEIKE